MTSVASPPAIQTAHADEIDQLLKATAVSFAELPNGETIAYRDFRPNEKGNVLVCLHGNAQDHTSWAELASHAALSTFRVIAVDMRGFGQSSYHKRIDSLGDLAQDIKLLCDKLQLARPMFIGWSTGGGVALSLATAYPDLPKAVFLLAAVAADGMRQPMYEADGKMAHPPKFLTTREHGAAVTASPFFATFYSSQLAESHAMWAAGVFMPGKCPTVDSPLYLRMHAGQQKQRIECRSDVMWALMSFNVTPIKTPCSAPSDALQSLRCPVAVIHGQHDGILNYEHAKALSTMINTESWAPQAPKFKFYTLSSGHMTCFENLDETVNTFRKACDELVQ